MNDYILKFEKEFEKLCYGKSEDEVFNHFLDIIICCLSGQQYEDEYLAIIGIYSKDKITGFCDLFAELILIMDNDGNGLLDYLGEFFTKHITKGRNGQFFTPIHVCDLMAAITIEQGMTSKTIQDPACGSGRMLLSAAKIERNNYFFGADIDNRCCKMTAINMCLNGLEGEVAWMNSLSQEHWGGFSVKKKFGLIPTIKKLNAGEGILANKKVSNEKVEDTIKVSQTKFEFD